MEERSLKVLANDTTFFNKISVTLTKLLTPTKIGINSMMISIKRSALIKAYEQVASLKNVNDVTKKEQADKRYEESFTLYLESIDRFIMDSIYKKVKNGTASLFEKDALSKYYTIVHLKENEYLEYKYRKQKFLLDLDYQTLKDGSKDKVLSKYQGIYVEKVDGLYKGILKNYSVKLADGIRTKKTNQIQIYKSIFETLEEYIKEILPIKLRSEDMPSYDKVLKEYEEYEKFSVGKLDEKEFVEKNMILLGLSRILFTHSLPLVAAEQCYNKLLRDTRNLIIKTGNPDKKEDVYQILLKLIEDYNVKLLSTKVYWEKPEEREIYKKFWNEYSKATSSEDKEILALRRELHDLKVEDSDKMVYLKNFYKRKLVEFGKMRLITKLRKVENIKYIKNSGLHIVIQQIQKKKKFYL